MRDIPDDRLGDAFGALSHELRLLVLEVLERERGTETFGAEPLPYSELVDRVRAHAPDDLGVDAGNFSYHLNVLRDAGFVRREGDGYLIAHAGVRIVRAIRAGNIGSEASFEAVPIEEPCPYCGGQSVLTLEDEWLFVTCRECPGAFAQDERLPEGALTGFPVTPASIRNRSPREMFRAALRVGLHIHRQFATGICPECHARTTTELLDICPDHAPDESGVCPECGRTLDEFLVVSCDVCERSLMTLPAIIVATDPAVAAELYARRYDLTELTWGVLSNPPIWPSEYVSRDPPVVEYTIPVPEGEPLRARIDRGLSVTVLDRSE